jgi:hypothetical protein
MGFLVNVPTGCASQTPRWDGTGMIVVHKKLDAGRFELPRATLPGEQHLLVSDPIFEVSGAGPSKLARVGGHSSTQISAIAPRAATTRPGLTSARVDLR